MFMAKSVERAFPFFRILKKYKRFIWTKECDTTVQQYKETLSAPPTLTKLDQGDTLYLYFAIANEAISTTLVKDNNKTQKLVYFVSGELQNAKL